MRATKNLYEKVGRWLPNLIAAAIFVVCFLALVRDLQRMFGALLGAGLVLTVWFWWWYNPSLKQQQDDE